MSELNILLNLVKQSEAKTVVEVREIVDRHFEDTIWSLLKDEWDQLTVDQKNSFVLTVFRNIIK